MTTWAAPATLSTGVVTAATWNSEVPTHLNWLYNALGIITRNTQADTGTATELGVTRAATSDVGFTVRVGADTNPRLRIQAGGILEWGAGNAAPTIQLQRDNDTTLKLNQVMLIERGTPGGDRFFAARLPGDTDPRVDMSTDSNNRGRIAFGAGNAAVDAFLTRDAAGRMLIPVGSSLKFEGAAGDMKWTVMQTGDTQARIRVLAGGTLEWGAGSGATDIFVYRQSAGWLKTDNHFQAVDGIQTLTFAGAITDARFAQQPGNGTIALDSTNHRLYVRDGGNWRFTALT